MSTLSTKADIATAWKARPGWIAAAFAAVLLLRQPAWAHAILIETVPPRNAMLAQPPREIRLRFNAKIERRVTHAALRRGETPVAPLEIVNEEKENLVTIRVPPLEAGVYTLRYKVLAADGHLTEGNLRFTVLTAR